MNIDFSQLYNRPGGAFGRLFCSAPHPDYPSDTQAPGGPVWCRRQGGHDGPHSAYTFSIAVPEEW